jgi:hypothetical protein
MIGRRMKYGTSSIRRSNSSSDGGSLGSSDSSFARGLRQAKALAGRVSPNRSRSSYSFSLSVKKSRSRAAMPLRERNSIACEQVVQPRLM